MESALSQMFTPTSWPAFVLISCRLTGLMVVAPIWSLASIPRPVRGALVVVLAAVLVPMSPAPPFPDRILSIPLPMLSELVVGLGIGLTAAVVTQAMMLASEVMALQTGLSLGQILSPSIDTGGPALSQLYGLLGLGVFVSVGGPASLIEAVAASLTEIPPGTLIGFERGGVAVLGVAGRIFGFAVQIVAPVMVAVTVANVAIAIISRAVPQLNAMAMSFAITLGIGLLMFGISLPLVARTVGRWSLDVPNVAGAVVEEMAAPDSPAGAR
jgi:flagellar biosynthesis protein FliR